MTGVAWLSSARVVRCWVKSRNERNPYCVLYHSHGTAERNSEEGEDDVKSAWPLRPGLQTCYNGRYTEGSETARWRQSQKTGLSSDCSLQLDCMKLESLVIADQQVAVNTFPGLVHTARQAMEAGGTRSRREAPKVKPVTGAKS